MGKTPRPLQGFSDIIDLDDQTDSNDSTNPPMKRNTRSKSTGIKKALNKINKLREEGGVGNFNPEKSLRERKKITKAVQSTQGGRKKNVMYGPTGIFLQTGQDLCDCQEEECPGCFYPCHKCGGPKCGGTCRRRRNWCYEDVTVDGQSKSSVKTNLSELLADIEGIK